MATARLAAFSAALRLAVPAEHELTLDPELHALYAPAVVAALDAALGDGAVAGGANALVDLGPYRELDQGGRVPFFLVPDNLTYLAFHVCAGLRHALRQYGGDPNIRYEVYDFPSLYSFTPLHAVVRYMARVADGTHAVRVDAAALARALLDAGAEPDARCEIVARYSSDEGAGRSPYTGPRFGATAAIMLAAPAPGAGFEDTTGPVSLAMLEELFRRGARLDVKAGNGKSIRQHRRLTPQARELLDRIAAERKAETSCCWMARG